MDAAQQIGITISIIVGLFVIVALVLSYREHMLNYREHTYWRGYDAGYKNGKETITTIMREQAIKAGVARYGICDSLTGATKFEWISPVVENGRQE